MAEAPPGARDGLSSVTRGTLVMMLGTLGFVAESFVARVLLIRGLTPDEWANFFVGLTLVGLLSAIGGLGIPSAVARTLPFEGDPREQRRVVRTSLYVVIPSAIALSGLLALLSLPIRVTFQSPLLAETLLFFAVAVGLSIVGGLLAAIFQGYEDVLPNALFVQVANPTLFILFLWIAKGSGPFRIPYTSALAAYTLSGVLAMAALLAYTRLSLPLHLPRGPSEPGVSSRLLRFAMPLFVVVLLGFVAGNVDALVLAAVDRSAVAFYSADLSLARLLQIGLGSLGFIILPVTARFVRLGDTASVRTTYTTATKWMVLTSLPLFLIFFLFPAPSLTFVYTASYAGTGVPLQIMLLGAFASTIVGPSTAAQVAFGQTRLLLYNTAIAATVDIILSVVLIPPLGVTGAALAWTAATGLYPVLSMAELAATVGVHPFRRHYLLPLVVTAVPSAAALFLVPFAPPLWSLPLIVLGIAGLFVLVVLVSRSLDSGDVLLLEALENVLGTRLTGLRRFGRRFLPPVPPHRSDP